MSRKLLKFLAGVAGVTALAVGGSAIAGAATSNSTTTPATAAMPGPRSAAHEAAEKAVTGSAATKAQAAAVKVVGGGTAGAVTTDYSGNGYEVTVTKSDGSTVEIHLDSSFDELQHGGPGGGPPPPTA